MRAAANMLVTLRDIRRSCGTAVAATYLRNVVRELRTVIRDRNLVAVDRRMAGSTWWFRVADQRIELDGEYFALARDLYCRQVYFPSSTFRLEARQTVVDLGANVGLFSVLAALRGCRTISVEAQPGFTSILEKFASNAGVRSLITIENALVGSGKGLFADDAALFGSSHAPTTRPPELSMRELVARHALDTIDFLKVDIEGSEFDVFAEPAGWLDRVRRVAMEVHPTYGSVEALVRTLREHDFSVELRDDDLQSVSELAAHPGYVFAHKR